MGPGFIVVIVILVGLFIFCCWGAVQSYKHSKSVKNLQASADYTFKTQQGPYRFSYMIKAFDSNGGKIVKIIVSPELGFSDLKNYQTNQLLSFSAEVNSKKPNQSFEYKEGNSLCATLTIELTPDYLTNGKLNAHFAVETSWSLSDPVLDTLEFTFDK